MNETLRELRAEQSRLQAENDRLRRQMAERFYATVYERAAWHHDIGEHADSDYPYEFCPRCEMMHPLGRFQQVLGVLKEAREELARWGWGDMHYGATPQEQSVVDMLAKIDVAIYGTPRSVDEPELPAAHSQRGGVS